MTQNENQAPAGNGGYGYTVEYLVDAFLSTLTPPARRQVLTGLNTNDQRQLLNTEVAFQQANLGDAITYLDPKAMEFIRTQLLALISWNRHLAYHSDLYAKSPKEYEAKYPEAFKIREEPSSESDTDDETIQ